MVKILRNYLVPYKNFSRPLKKNSIKKIYKYVIGYLYNDNKVKPLYIMFPKTSLMKML